MFMRSVLGPALLPGSCRLAKDGITELLSWAAGLRIRSLLSISSSRLFCSPSMWYTLGASGMRLLLEID